ncbi:MAG: di-trans,poly-cis-decaprenylcistransferase [Candidatus Bathyarchaeota archaeon]|nr:MAG: di-trans,poly-cis-decaprenylcistransferase [Candidatus Bathyarchaeota archaeon]
MLKSLLSLLGIYKLYEKWLWYQIKNGRKPEHIALILDGNRRWATGLSLNPWAGHHHGARKTEDLLDWCLDLGVKSITLYAFSTENFQRSRKEVDEIMRIVEEKLGELLKDERIHKNKVRVKVIGRPNLLPENLQEITERVEKATKDYDMHFLNLALAYGGRAEIVDAAKEIAERVRTGDLATNEIDEALFEKHLYTAHMPQQDSDLIIRTSGEERMSGFLLWQSAYSELCFLDVYWPAFRRIDLLRAIRTFQMRKRRFGQ